MDEEHTASYQEPCAQCLAVDWGLSDEGHFYCRTCHSVIERTREVEETRIVPGSSRVSTLSSGRRTKTSERGREWSVCEAFQFILRNQAEALLRLGASPHFKDQVLCPLWRLYLQRTRQAYTQNLVTGPRFRLRSGPDSDPDPDGLSETDPETNFSDSAGSLSSWSQCSGSGSVDAVRFLSPRLKRCHGLMTMKRTLALLHLALVWSREALTLSDLLRLVGEGHVPYVGAFEDLPEEMVLRGKDVLIFRVESVPSHRSVHAEAQVLLRLLQLPAFPPISRQSLLHPALLGLRYLADANLPDELHPWLCRLMERAGMADEALHTCGGWPRPFLPRYDVQAAALVVVTVKVAFGLDDRTEWDSANQAGDDATGERFSIRKWFRLLQASLTRAQLRKKEDVARKQWTTRKPLSLDRQDRNVTMKRKRTAEQIQDCFEKLSSCPVEVQRLDPSSFRFCWGDQAGADGPSLHHKKLDGVVTPDADGPASCSASYWHCALRRCKRKCRGHYSELEASLPRSFVWMLRLFSFLLDVAPDAMFEEVLRVERRLFGPERSKKRRTKTTRSGSEV